MLQTFYTGFINPSVVQMDTQRVATWIQLSALIEYLDEAELSVVEEHFIKGGLL